MLDVSLDGGRQELVTEVLVSRDSTEGVRKVATWQRKLLHEKCYEGFSMLSFKNCEKFHLQSHE